LKLNNELLQQTTRQINEMQESIREAARQVAGAQEYIQKQMALFENNHQLKEAQNLLKREREAIANEFFKNHQHTIESVTKNILGEPTRTMLDNMRQTLKHHPIEITPLKKSDDAE